MPRTVASVGAAAISAPSVVSQNEKDPGTGWRSDSCAFVRIVAPFAASVKENIVHVLVRKIP
jgi:hypothetical protein